MPNSMPSMNAKYPGIVYRLDRNNPAVNLLGFEHPSGAYPFVAGIPPNTYYIASTGSDANPGTGASPGSPSHTRTATCWTGTSWCLWIRW